MPMVSVYTACVVLLCEAVALHNICHKKISFNELNVIKC